jgi:hypothetical protein
MRIRTAIVVALAALPGTTVDADTRVYLGEYKFGDPKMYAIGPGGGDVEELPIIPAADWLVVGVQVDVAGGKIYWTHGGFGEGRVRRADLDGTGMETLRSGLTNPRGLAIDVDGGKMYWSDTQDNRMYRANLDGSGITETIVDTGHQLGRPTLDVAGGKIYFGNFTVGDMRRANLDGADPEILFDGLFTPVAVALDPAAGKIYWADSNTSFVSNHIVRANLDGTKREVLYEGLPTSSGFTGIGLDLAAGRLYWSDEITDVEKGLWEANLDGTDATRIFASPSGWNAGAMTVVVTATPCPADIDGNGMVDTADLLAVLAAWGGCVDCPEDIDRSGIVDTGDLLVLLGNWGPCPQARGS